MNYFTNRKTTIGCMVLLILFIFIFVIKQKKEAFEEPFLYIHIPKTGGTSFRNAFDNIIYIEHQTALSHEYKKQKMKKVTIVRNPYERCLSAYLFLKKGGMKNDTDINYQEMITKYQNFKEFLRDLKGLMHEIIHFIPQHKFIEDESGILVDHILHLENIESDVKQLCNKMKIDTCSIRKENTNKHKHYKTYYDKESQNIVYNLYKRDFELLGYTYEL